MPAVQRLIDTYLSLRVGPEETFLLVYRRVGAEPFKRALYPEQPVPSELPVATAREPVGAAELAGSASR